MRQAYIIHTSNTNFWGFSEVLFLLIRIRGNVARSFNAASWMMHDTGPESVCQGEFRDMTWTAMTFHHGQLPVKPVLFALLNQDSMSGLLNSRNLIGESLLVSVGNERRHLQIGSCCHLSKAIVLFLPLAPAGFVGFFWRETHTFDEFH